MKNVSTYVNWWRQFFKPWQRHLTMKTTCDCINSVLGSRDLWHQETDRNALSHSYERSLNFVTQLMLVPHEMPLLSIKVWKCESLSCVWLFVTPWTVAHQAPLSIGFSRQEYWSGQPFPSLGHLPNPGIKPGSPTLQVDSFPSGPPGKPIKNTLWFFMSDYAHHHEIQKILITKKKHGQQRGNWDTALWHRRQRCGGRIRRQGSLTAGMQGGHGCPPQHRSPTPTASVSLRCSPLKWKCIGKKFWGRWFSQTKLTHYKATTGEGKGYPLQCPGLENSRDEAWVTESTRLSDLHYQYH